MKLSERGALKSAICDGGYNIYPAAKLVEYIRSNLSDEDFKGYFDPASTVKKLRSVKIEGNKEFKSIFNEDLNLICSRLESMNPEYDIESTFKKMSVDLPKMARHYFSIEDYQPVKTEVVEYFFEGYNDLYKDADWNAFNIDAAESKEYGVPIGIYFKRSQVAPGYPEYVVMHESVHQFTAAAGMDDLTHYYIPWIMEGFADVFGYLMLYRITRDMDLITKVKNLTTELDVLDSRKVTYHYETNIASQFISTAGIVYTKAFLKAMESCRHEFDWSAIGNAILRGKTAVDATADGYIGTDKSGVLKKISDWEKEYRSQGEFDEDDQMILRYFSSTQGPATLPAPEFTAARWLMRQLDENTAAHYVHTKYLDGKLGAELIKIGDIGIDKWQDVPKGYNAFLVSKDDIPSNLQEGAEKLSNYFFVVKKKFGGKLYYDVFGGGLPYRMRTGELRCAI